MAHASMRIELTPVVLQTLEVDWVVEETTTLVKKARRGKRYSVGVSLYYPCLTFMRWARS